MSRPDLSLSAPVLENFVFLGTAHEPGRREAEDAPASPGTAGGHRGVAEIEPQRCRPIHPRHHSSLSTRRPALQGCAFSNVGQPFRAARSLVKFKKEV